MKAKQQVAFIAWRYYLVISIVLLIVIGLCVRLINLAILDKNFLRNQSNIRTVRVLTAPAFRGMIMDRNGYPLAISTAVYSIWLDPKKALIKEDKLASISELLEIKPLLLKMLIEKNTKKGREFVYLKRNVSPELARKLKALKIPGLNLSEEYKRFYPEGEVAAHIIGFTNIDDKGQEGLELIYNDWLAGSSGKRVVVKDRIGRPISEVKTLVKQNPGKDITLSIDRRIQYLAYRELLAGVQKNFATSGSVVVLDIKTGEVLAMVNQPSYNPNNRITKSDAMRNRAITDIFEPGSTIKAFSVATALDSGLYKPDTIINTYPGWMRVGGHLVRDEHSKGPMTVTQILQISSNVGISKMILTLPPSHLWELLHKVGFGEPTEIGFPGERSGKLEKRDNWKPFALATLAFGYGISVTTLQLAHAYATLANDGIKIPLSLLKLEKQPIGEQVLNKKLANEMITLLESVVAKGGTAEKIHIPGFRISGKTGTARMLGPNGYEKDHHISSFVGIAPVSNPRLVVAVVIQDPHGKQYYGADVSGPAFSKIMEGALRILNIPPDDIAA